MSKHMDYIYFDEDYFNKPKETFSFLLKQILKSNPSKEGLKILDLGCARGELLYYLQRELGENNDYYGLDYSPDLIENAKGNPLFKNMEFMVGNAEKFSWDKNFDFILSLGVTGYFDSMAPTMDMLVEHLAPGGRCFLFHLFNEYDIDVQVRYRHNQRSDQFEPGWNLHSIKTIEREAEKKGLVIGDVERFELSFEDSPKDDPARSWTMDNNGRRYFRNGLGQLYSLFSVEVNKS